MNKHLNELGFRVLGPRETLRRGDKPLCEVGDSLEEALAISGAWKRMAPILPVHIGNIVADSPYTVVTTPSATTT